MLVWGIFLGSLILNWQVLNPLGKGSFGQVVRSSCWPLFIVTDVSTGFLSLIRLMVEKTQTTTWDVETL